MSVRIHGWPYRTLDTGERVPVAPWLVGWRRLVWEYTTEAFGWWGFSHKQKATA